MTIINEGAGPSDGLVARVRNILVTPKTEWPRIDVEPATIKGLYLGYICILAAIGPVAGAVGGLIFGRGLPGIVMVRPSLGYAIGSAIIAYLLSLAVVAIIALIIEALAPSFGGVKDRVKAFKTAAYSFTAAWVAAVFALIPMLGWVGWLLGFYSFYLLYLGLQDVMKSPKDKVVGYLVVTTIISIVAQWLILGLAGWIMLATVGVPSMTMARNSAAESVVIGGHRVDVGKMQAAAEQMQAAGRGDPGAIKAVPGPALQALLPTGLAGGFGRTEVSTNSASAGGVGGSSAEARYSRGDASIELNVTDMAAMGAIASLGGALNVSSTHETATGYEKAGVVNGRMTTESYDRESKSGKYGVLIGERFMVEAQGQQVAVDDLKQAVAAVDARRLEGLAKG